MNEHIVHVSRGNIHLTGVCVRLRTINLSGNGLGTTQPQGTIRGSYVQKRFFFMPLHCLIERIEKFMFVQSFEYLEVAHVLRTYMVYQHQVTKLCWTLWMLKLYIFCLVRRTLECMFFIAWRRRSVISTFMTLYLFGQWRGYEFFDNRFKLTIIF